jgi:hypothetical protein
VRRLAARWVCFALIDDGTAEEGGTNLEVQPTFFAVTNAIVTPVRDRLGT